MIAFDTYVPAGWALVDLTDDVELDRLERTLIQSAPLTRQPTARKLVDDELRPTLWRLGEQGTQAVLLPTDLGAVRSSVPLIAYRPMRIPDDVDPVEFLATMAAETDGAELVDLPAVVGIRSVTSRTSRLTPQDITAATGAVGTTLLDGEAVLTREVAYVVGLPDDRERWMTVSMTVDHTSTPTAHGAADRAERVLEAVMTTFRWVA